MNTPSALADILGGTRLIRRAARFLAVAIFLVGGGLLLAAPSAWAFGCEGHEIIALIAEKHLTPNAQAIVEKILKDNPIDPALNRYCKQPNLDAMAYSSTWADDYRSAHRETAPWHQVDIPINITTGNLTAYCLPPESCVTQALLDQLAILRSPDTDPKTRADALRFVIHFVGDLHQPLHVANNNDLGGNCVPVTFFDDTPEVINPIYETYAPNLHGLWDYGILDRAMPDKTVQQIADELDRTFSAQEEKWMQGPVDPEAWTWEGFHLAKDIVYGKLPVAIPPERPVRNTTCSEDNHISNRMLRLNEQIRQPYQDIAAPVVEQQLAKAGARLALILNQIWP